MTMTPPLNKLVEKYLELGWFLIPIDPVLDKSNERDRKKPFKGFGMSSASNDLTQILEWHEQSYKETGQACNWAVVLNKSGLIAIDVDSKEQWEKLLSKYPGLNATLCQSTGRHGGGWHYFYKAPENGVKLKKNPNGYSMIDIKHNGYVVVAPSIHETGNPYHMNVIDWDEVRISELRQDFLNLISARTDRLRKATKNGTFRDQNPIKETTDYGFSALMDECERIQNAEKGERNNTLYSCLRNLKELIAGEEIRPKDIERIYRIAEAKGLSEREIAATDKSSDIGYTNPRSAPQEALVIRNYQITGEEKSENLSDKISLQQYHFAYNLESLFLHGDKVRNGLVKLVPTGIESLDNLLGGGLRPGTLTLLASAPGNGKTSLALHMALKSAFAGDPVIFWTADMSTNEVRARLVSISAGISWGKVEDGWHHDDIGSLCAELWSKPLYIIPSTDIPSIELLAQKAIEVMDIHGKPPLVIIDYLQVKANDLRYEGRGQDLRESSNFIAKSLKDLSHNLDLCVLAISSVGRMAYNVLDRSNKPNYSLALGAAKESGELEFTAGAVLVIGLVQPVANEPGRKGYIIVPKTRRGSIGAIPVHFNGLDGLFTEIGEEELPTPEYVQDRRKAKVYEVLSDTDNPIFSKRALARGAGGNTTTTLKIINEMVDNGEIYQDKFNQFKVGNKND